MEKRHQGRAYEYLKQRQYMTRAGEVIMLDVWRARCVECERPFECATSARSKKFNPTKRCEKHRRSRVPA